VFADEPTGSLDSVGADEVMELLVDTAKQQGTAVLMVTHEPRVAGYADRTVLMRDGVESMRVSIDEPTLASGGDSVRVTAADADWSADRITW
jgi:ABC-type lipoprotein export system ATPase subunit